MGQGCSGLQEHPCSDVKVQAEPCQKVQQHQICSEKALDIVDLGIPPSVAQSTVRHVDLMAVPQGGVYTGQVREDGQPHGQGVQRWTDGSVFNGSWKAGSAHGQGKLTKLDGSTYEGSWFEGRKHGEGVEQMVDEGDYKGEFADGLKSGHGAFLWKGGESYEGEFSEDALQGEGVFIWPDGRTYRGQWMQSRMHGTGRFEWPDGTAFEGKYENDKKHGPGVFSWPSGAQSTGIWQQGKQNGLGHIGLMLLAHADAVGHTVRMSTQRVWHGRVNGLLVSWINGLIQIQILDPREATTQIVANYDSMLRFDGHMV